MKTPLRWRAKWIGKPLHLEADAMPAIYFRKRFSLAGTPRSASLRITACGLFEASVNGQPISQDVLVPGWSDYHHRVDYLEYNVTSHLTPGDNRIEVTLAEGWYSAYLSEPQFRIRYGSDPMLLAQLTITDDRGREQVIGTDDSWETGTGPIGAASLYHGETFDARRGVKFSGAAMVQRAPKIEISEKICPPVRRVDELSSIAVSRSPQGGWIFDLGENIAGWVRLSVRARRGTKLTLRYGEMLGADGSLYVENLRSARATDHYICKGQGTEIWEPRFTFHGFRYVEVQGFDGQPTPEMVTGIVLQSALSDAGSFECSDSLLNQLHRCVVRSQRGNFIDLPTDCPQRDERLGWAGDAQIFCRTALYNQHAAPLFQQWMRAMRDGQREDGAFPDIAPHIILEHGNAGWSDAGIIVPWTVWRMTGDTAILEENYDAMRRHLDWIKKCSPSGIRRECMFGDWLAVDAKNPQFAPTPRDLIGTAYYVRVADAMRDIAAALRRKSDVGYFGRAAASARKAFTREFITPAGRIVGDTQTGHAMALGFNLVPARLRTAAISRLVELVRERDWHLASGFLGTPLLCPVLARTGHVDVAWRVLMQTTYPGWLYPVVNGATTMWERWDSWTREKGFGDVSMNSFNHYAYGAIGEFLYATVGGLDQQPGSSGFRHLRIAPQPGGGVTEARTTHRTPQGEVRIEWRIEGRKFSLAATVPNGCIADIILPGSRQVRRTEAGVHTFSCALR